MNDLANALDQIDLPEQSNLPATVLNWSDAQKAVFEFVKTGTGNAVVEAVAGSGKTVTLVEALKYTDSGIRVGFVAFNKRIANELRERSPDHVHVSTLHSLGLKNMTRAFPGVKIETGKMWKLYNVYEKTLPWNDRQTLRNNSGVVLRLVSMLKATLLAPHQENMDYIVDRYNLAVGGQVDFVYESATQLWQMSHDSIEKWVDFDDMIYAPGARLVPCQKFDFLFVDEAQDLNNAQIQFVLNSVADSGRVVAVGDRFQSIYGFRGADTDAIPNLIEALDAITLPLSITYRCPSLVVELAQKYVVHIQARDDAPDGTVKTIPQETLLQYVEEGDLVICRTNAPLVAPAFALIRSGMKAVILGREIGKGLINLIDRVGRRNASKNVVELLLHMRRYTSTEITKLIAADKHSRAISLQDQFDTIIALANDCDEISEIKSKISQVFDDNRKGITFSSVHKIKGGEAKRVFILEPDNMPHPMAKSDWEREQEIHIIYVAYTRAKEELYFVN